MRSFRASELIGERLKGLRKLRGWSAKQLGKRCAERGASHLTPYVIANIETKRRIVSADDLLALAYACDVSPTYFLGLPDGKSGLSVTDTAAARDGQDLLRWLRGDAPLPGMDEAFFTAHGNVQAGMSDVDYGRALLLAGSKRLIAQYDARADQFVKATREQVRSVIGDLRQAVGHNVPQAEIIEFLDEVESELGAAAGPDEGARPAKQ